MVRVSEPVVVCGDVHGQFFDLVTLLGKNADPSKTNFVFLGDYVDRGVYGVEVVLLLISIKVTYTIAEPLCIAKLPIKILHATR